MISSVHETAYPRFKPDLTERELSDVYTPTVARCIFAQGHWKQRIPRFALLVLLKTTQRLGYVAKLSDVPPPVLNHIVEQIGVHNIKKRNLSQYDQSGARQLLLGLYVSGYALNPFPKTVKYSFKKRQDV